MKGLLWPHQAQDANETISHSAPHTILREDLESIIHVTKQEGLKFDGDKPDLSLVPGEFSAEVARGFMYGASKYGRYNYLNGMDWHRLVAAAKRHVDAFQEGEDSDPESGVSHLAHAACGLAMLIVFQKRNLGTDTRYKK